MYECPNCAANLKFNIARQMLYCENCETTVDPYAFHKEKDAEERVVSAADVNGEKPAGIQEEEYEVTIFSCPQCGGEILSEDTTAATFCSFCGSATILDSRISRERRPGYIIPFTKTKKDCEKAYAKMMHRAFFAPSDLKDKAHIEKFRGIYMPYWVYSFEKNGPASFRGKKTYRRGDYVYSKYYQLDCEVEESYKGFAYDASASFSDNLSNAIAPFDLKEGKPFAPTFLSGFYADTNDVDRYVYESEAENIVIGDACKRIVKQRGCRKYHVNEGSNLRYLKSAVRPTECKAELAMLPVWFLSYRNGDRVSYAVVNGQTGEVAADLPVDFKKYVIGSAVLAVPLFILLNLFFTIRPTTILWIAAILAVICALISNVQMSGIVMRESGADDKGLMFAKKHGYMSEASTQGQDLAEAMAAGRERQRRKKRDNPTTKALKMVGISLLVMIAVAALPTVVLPMVTRSLMTGMMTGEATVSYTINLMPILSRAMLFLFIGCFFLPIIISVCKQASGKKKSSFGRNMKVKLPTLMKPIAALVLAVVIQILNPVADEFYYIGAFVCMGAILWAIMDIIKQHNLLTTRKLPQFNKRGGDENA